MQDTAHVIGMGEVGRRLAQTLESAGWSVRSVTRGSGWESALDEADPAPRIVCTREEALAEVLGRLPTGLRDRVVLLQNGFLEPVHGDLGPVTRGLIYFTSKADFFRVLCASPFHGPHAERLALALDRGGIPTRIDRSREDYLRSMIVKGVWNAVVGLPLAVHGSDLATYMRERRDEMERLCDESARAAGAEYGVAVDGAAAMRKIVDTTAELGWVRGGAKALAWRNGALAWFGRRHGIPTPVNDALLRDVGYDPGSVPSSS